jgi:hypothetical protein
MQTWRTRLNPKLSNAILSFGNAITQRAPIKKTGIVKEARLSEGIDQVYGMDALPAKRMPVRSVVRKATAEEREAVKARERQAHIEKPRLRLKGCAFGV